MVNAYVVAGVRWRSTTAVSPYQFTCCVIWMPLAKMRYPTKSAQSSVDRVQVSETCEGPRTIPESCGVAGGVVSRGVVTVTVLLFPDWLSALSEAVTENVYVWPGLSQSIVYAVCPGGTVKPCPPME